MKIELLTILNRYEFFKISPNLELSICAIFVDIVKLGFIKVNNSNSTKIEPITPVNTDNRKSELDIKPYL